MSERPEWVVALSRAASQVSAEQISRFAPPATGGRPSAVLIALREDVSGPAVLLIERASSMRTHAGQVAFPGGGADPDDRDATDTALREAAEEVGLLRSSVEVLATLPDLFLPPSGFVVSPVLGWWARPHPVGVVDANEVAGVHVVPIAELADPRHRFRVAHPSGYVGPGFEAGGLFVWGFTAGLLDAVLHLGGWARPWDETRSRPLPERMVGRVPTGPDGTAAAGTLPP